MAYVREKDGAGIGGVGGLAKGFGQTEGSFEDFLKKSCAVDPTQPACKAYFDQLFGKVRADSKNYINSVTPGIGHVLAQALDGSSNPADIIDRAKKLASGFSLDPVKKSAYEFFYSQARTGLEIADQYLSAYPEAAAIGVGLRQGENLYLEGKSLFQKYEKTGLDASGVADVMSLMKKSLTVARSLVRSLGVAEGSVADEVMDWTSIAAGCGVSIAAGFAAGGVGTIGGAMTCAVSVLAKVFSKIHSTPPSYDLGEVAHARFMPMESQRGLIAADAQRLASLLRYRYGIPSFKSMFDQAPVGTNDPAWTMLRKYTTKARAVAVGFTPRQTFQILGGNMESMTGGLNLGIFNTTGGIDTVKLIDHIQKTGSFVPSSGSPEWMTRGVDGARRWAELVTFFAATTARELSVDSSYISPWADGLPVRMFNMTESGVSILPHLGNQSRYSSEYWAHGRSIFTLVDQVGLGNVQAMLEFGVLRLMAAFSFIRMAYAWGERTSSSMTSLSGGKDMIAEFDNLDIGNPASQLRYPIDPRRVAWGGMVPTVQQLLNAIVSRSVMMNSIASKARADAQGDFKVVQLAGAAKRQMLMLQAGAPTATAASTSALKKLIAEGGVQTVTEERKKCAGAGGEYFPGGAQCDINPTTKRIENCRQPPAGYPVKDRYTCVPAGTPGAQAIPPSGILPSTGNGEVKKASGIGTILAIAGAGLLLMRLLRS